MRFNSKRYLAYILGLFFVACTTSVHAQDALKSRSVFNAEYLSSSGMVRLGDLFKELPLWNSYSSDGFTHYSNNSFSGYDYSRQTWSLFIDGRIIDQSVLGFNDLNTLPFSIHDLDSIEVFHRPIMIAGVWAGDGAIHVHTKKTQGVHFQTELYLGNEVDDPGPFIYTELEPVNIDRIGPDFSTSLRFGLGDFYTNVSLQLKEHHSTDSRISARTKALHDLSNRAPRKILIAPSFRMGFQSDKTLTEWGFSSSFLDDFPYLPTFGAEIPMSQNITSYYFKGRYSIGDHFAAFANLTRNEDHLKNRFNYLYWDPAFKLSLFRTRIGVELNAGRGIYQMGFGSDRHKAEVWIDDLERSAYSGRHFFVSAQQSFGKNLFLIQTELGSYDEQILPKMLFHWSRSDTELSLSYNKRSNTEKAHLWYWMDEGYDQFSRLGRNVVGFQNVTPAEDYAALLSQGFKLGATVNSRLLFGFRSHQNDWSVQKRYFYQAGMTRFLGDLDLETGITGSRRFWGLSIHHQLKDQLSHELSYVHMQTYRHSNDRYKNRSKQLPELRFQYRLHYRASPGFHLGTLFRSSSSTEWDDFDTLDPRLTPNFDGSRIPNQLQWDIYAKKTFFDRRLWTSMRLENILDKPLQEWPIGEIQHMTFHVMMGMQLGNDRK